MNRPTRRSFLGQASFIASSFCFHDTLPLAAGAQQKVRVRQNIKALDPGGAEIKALREAFRVIRDRSDKKPNDPTGWLFQANIHRDACSHANWWFLPWHRAYLYYFERILQHAAQEPALALPYWDWSDTALSENRRLLVTGPEPVLA